MDKSVNVKPKRKLLRPATLNERKARAGYVFVLPFILGLILIYIPVIIDSIWFSFNSLVWDASVMDYVLVPKGLEYYQTAMSTSTFVEYLLSGLQQLVFEVPAIIIFSLFIAVVLNQKMLGRAVFRAIFFIPVIIATGLMESINASDVFSDSTESGIDDGSGSSGASEIISVMDVERLFGSMKIGQDLVLYVVDLVNNVYDIINYSGVQMLIFLAGLQSISPAIYEACQIEGATAWETFWKVTFPMISPMILVNAIYTIIDSFTKNSNITMSYISNNVTDMHLATAMSWIYFAIVMLIIAVFVGIASSFIFYQRRD